MPFTAYIGTLKQFYLDAVDNKIADKIAESCKMNRIGFAQNEFSSWERSLTLVAIQLRGSNLSDNVGIACELMPGRGRTSIDLVISGYDNDGNPNIIIVELKQWSSVDFSEVGDGWVYTNVGGRKFDDKQHPALQALGYKSTLNKYNMFVEEYNIRINSCAYLHNMKSAKIIKHDQFSQYFDLESVFIKDDRSKFIQFITNFISKGDNCKIINGITNSIIRPSQKLALKVGDIMKSREIYIPVEEQQKAIDTILRASIDGVSVAQLNIAKQNSLLRKKSSRFSEQNNSKKHVIIIEGGPGSGKSVIAVNVLAKLIEAQKNSMYCTPNIPLKDNIRINFDKECSDNFNDSFQGPIGFTKGNSNEFEVLIVDEAQRLSERFALNANMLYSPEKAIETSLCTVFFVDERQMTSFMDIGSVKRIISAADKENASIQRFNLQTRFRCNGSLEYEQWLGNILGYDEEEISFSSVDFDFEVMDSARELSEKIKKLNSGEEMARLTASYCWEYKTRQNPDAIDFILDGGDFTAQWNSNFSGSAKQTWLASDPIERIGWVNEIQGNEVDYVGVIIGPDIYYNPEKDILEIDYNKHNIKSAAKKGCKAAIKRKEIDAVERCENAIRNCYWVLLTRATKGCFIYSEDPQVRDYLKRMSEK
tara:strand:+ start:453 stop:2399 length:1947 start_codon:yes stop_codon:yes gene_type:complete